MAYSRTPRARSRGGNRPRSWCWRARSRPSCASSFLIRRTSRQALLPVGRNWSSFVSPAAGSLLGGPVQPPLAASSLTHRSGDPEYDQSKCIGNYFACNAYDRTNSICFPREEQFPRTCKNILTSARPVNMPANHLCGGGVHCWQCDKHAKL